MGRRISVELLDSHGACYGGKDAFEVLFGKETVFSPTEEIAQKLALNSILDIRWGAEYLLNGPHFREFLQATKMLDHKIYELRSEEYRVYENIDAIWHNADAEYRSTHPHPNFEKSDQLIALEMEHNLEAARVFLDLYERYGLGDAVDEPPKED